MKIGIISDIHEDIIRLKETFVLLEKEACDKIVCLGDFVGYSVPYNGFFRSRNATEVIKLLKSKCNYVLVGNHDLFAVRKVPESKAGFKYPKNWYSLDFEKRKEISKGKIHLYEDNELSALLNKKEAQFIKKLPEFTIIKSAELNILFSHYAYPDLTGSTTKEYFTKYDEVKKHFDFMKKNNCLLGISGHDHIEGIRIFTNKEVTNVPFNRTIKLPEEAVWLNGPSIVNGTFANGFMILDTNKKEIKAIPLKTKKHKSPKWKKL